MGKDQEGRDCLNNTVKELKKEKEKGLDVRNLESTITS